MIGLYIKDILHRKLDRCQGRKITVLSFPNILTDHQLDDTGHNEMYYLLSLQ